MATIRIKNLKLSTIIGTNDWEREHKQDVVINVKIDFDASKASESDNLNDTINYHAITKRITDEVEQSSFFLLEKLAKCILKTIIENPLVQEACVRVDKPRALDCADSVSVELSEQQP